MKKILCAFVLLSIQGYSQEFQGMAVYESKTSIGDFAGRIGNRPEITPEMQKSIEERVKKAMEKTFVLNFDKTSSIYKEEEKLDAPGQQNSGFRMMNSMMGTGGTFYKNVKEKKITVDKEFLGKEFLIQDSLPSYQWKMEGETKQIGGYTCYKATALKPASKSDFRNFRAKKEEEKATSEKSTNIMDYVEIPKEIEITAWYAPEIAVNQGPENYWGLPGLILEISDGKTVILCSKIVLNPKQKTEIKAPTKGKVVSQKEFDAIVVEKMEEMRQNFQNGRQTPRLRIGN
ncbi:GLPGLI family protein [Flavobacterium sp. NST-5]|uniref:GLPGLI family protein n=1 Tax=Flavobacterium ichthyis TaxID=2698827 RepID=A0ABW9Z512_9FLAO|nr:GLPGLI family protein [Flavobacterium ichthyis]NBL63774.1 GLPGLI family protein [Flavobacterium ichthyis]